MSTIPNPWSLPPLVGTPIPVPPTISNVALTVGTTPNVTVTAAGLPYMGVTCGINAGEGLMISGNTLSVAPGYKLTKKAAQSRRRKKAPALKVSHDSLAAVVCEPIAPYLETLFAITWDDTTLRAVMDGLPAIGQDGPWLAGGALRRTLLGQEPDGDFDLFFKDQEQFRSYCKALKKAGFTRTENKSANYAEFQAEVAGKSRLVQCVCSTFYDNARAVVSSFDFTICMFAYDGTSLFMGANSIDHLEQKQLHVNLIASSIKSMSRVLKYAKQDFMPTKHTLLAINQVFERNNDEDNIIY